MASRRSTSMLVAVAVATLMAAHSAAARQLTAAPTSGLSKGAGTFLQHSKYTTFYEIVQKLEKTTSYEDLTEGWSKAPTNQTLLVVSNDNLNSGFTQLAQTYKIKDAQHFLARLIKAADGEVTSSSPQLTKPFAAAIVLVAFAETHTLPQPENFFANQAILKAPFASPVTVPTAITAKDGHSGALQAFGESLAPGPEHLYLKQKGGLLHASQGVEIPRHFLSAKQGSKTLYVYELNGIFVYGKAFGPADTTQYSPAQALTYLAKNGF